MKLFGIALSTVATAAVLLASGALAAEIKPTVLCKSGPESGACEESDYIADGTLLHSSASNVTLTTGGMTVTCEKSAFESKTIESSETLELRAEVTEVTFSGCTGLFKTACTVTAHHLAFNAAFAAGEKHGDGRLAIWERSGKGLPAAEVKCSALGFDCEYRAGEELKVESAGGTVKAFQLQVHGAKPATATAKEARFTASTPEGGNCLGITEGRLNGEWKVNEPSPLFVELAPVGVTVIPTPIVIEKPGDTVTVEIENSGKRNWSIGALGTVGQITLVEVESGCKAVTTLKPGEKCRQGIKCIEEGEWKFFIGVELPKVDVLSLYITPVIC